MSDVMWKEPVAKGTAIIKQNDLQAFSCGDEETRPCIPEALLAGRLFLHREVRKLFHQQGGGRQRGSKLCGCNRRWRE